MCNVYAAMNMSYLYTILYMCLNLTYIFCIYIYIYIFAFVMNFPPPTHQSSALHQAALDAMDVGPTLLQSNKARNSQYQNTH